VEFGQITCKMYLELVLPSILVLFAVSCTAKDYAQVNVFLPTFNKTTAESKKNILQDCCSSCGQCDPGLSCCGVNNGQCFTCSNNKACCGSGPTVYTCCGGVDICNDDGNNPSCYNPASTAYIIVGATIGGVVLLIAVVVIITIVSRRAATTTVIAKPIVSNPDPSSTTVTLTAPHQPVYNPTPVYTYEQPSPDYNIQQPAFEPTPVYTYEQPPPDYAAQQAMFEQPPPVYNPPPPE